MQWETLNDLKKQKHFLQSNLIDRPNLEKAEA